MLFFHLIGIISCVRLYCALEGVFKIALDDGAF